MYLMGSLKGRTNVCKYSDERVLYSESGCIYSVFFANGVFNSWRV